MEIGDNWRLAVAVGFVVVGVGALLRAAITLRRLRSTTWVSTIGRVNRAETRSDPAAEGLITASISYEYEVDGRIYRSSVVAADGPNGLSRASDVELARRHKPDDVIEVFYSQADPGRACLRPERLDEVPVLIVAGCVSTILGLYLLW